LNSTNLLAYELAQLVGGVIIVSGGNSAKRQESG
jgi:hypothetical protein